LFFGEEEKRQVLEVLEPGYLFRYGTPGDRRFKAKVWQLQQAFARYTGTKYALTVNSGTSPLLTGLNALDIGPGDEVLFLDIPSLLLFHQLFWQEQYLFPVRLTIH